MSINLLDILILGSLFQGLIFGLGILLSKAFRGTVAKYLAYSILLIAMIGLNEILSRWNFDDQYYFIDFFGDDVPWILLYYIPLFFFFRKSSQQDLRPIQKALLFFPFAFFLLLNILINLDVDFGLYRIPNIDTFKSRVYEAEYYTALALSIILCLLSYHLVVKKNLPFADAHWLKRIWLFSALLILSWLLLVLIPSNFRGGDRLWDYIFWLGISSFIYWLTYKGLYQFKLAKDVDHPLLSPQAVQTIERNKPSPTPSFTKENPYFQQLEQLMNEEEIFRDPNLNRDVIAQRLGISPGYFSQLINAVTGDSITHYMNTYRVEAVKQMIKDPSFAPFSLLAIGKEAGFTSKSAFYTTFKKMTGMTPNAFKNSS